ncbi:MAG: transporter substrate-binding domain-containing protein, partial [Pseudomonas sp.]|uniref:substrate-binding periplasmic protein n=1 Tax=Pseudomonas sp. TaxID=306 RepID=UPI003397A812
WTPPPPRRLGSWARGVWSAWPPPATLVVLDNANPPFMYQQDGQPRGLYPRMLHAIFTHAGEPVEIRAVPWKRALLLGESAAAGIGGIYMNRRRLQVFDYSAPLFEEKLRIYVRKDRVFPFESVEDLTDKEVGTIRGWSYSESFDRAVREQRINARESTSDESNFRKLASGRLDAVIAIEESGQQMIRRLRLDGLVPLAKPLSVNPTYLVFAKDAEHRELLAKFNASLRAMRDDGSLQALIEQATTQD